MRKQNFRKKDFRRNPEQVGKSQDNKAKVSFTLNTPLYSHSSIHTFTNPHVHTHTHTHSRHHNCEKSISVVYNPPSLRCLLTASKRTKTLTYMHPRWHTDRCTHTHTPTHIPHTYKNSYSFTHAFMLTLCPHIIHNIPAHTSLTYMRTHTPTYAHSPIFTLHPLTHTGCTHAAPSCSLPM